MSNDKYVAMDVHKASVVIGVRDGGANIGRPWWKPKRRH